MEVPLPNRCENTVERRITKLIPPPNFGMVEDGLYRSGQPSNLSFSFLDTLHLRSVIWLAPELPQPNFVEWMQLNEVEFHQLVRVRRDEQDATPNDPINESTVLSAIDLILDVRVSPTIVMCAQGRHRTGTVIGIFRRLQNLGLSSVFEEYRRFAGQKLRVQNEQFIEMFDCDLVVIPS